MSIWIGVIPRIEDDRIKEMFRAYPGYDRFLYRDIILEEEIMQDITEEDFIKIFRDNGY